MRRRLIPAVLLALVSTAVVLPSAGAATTPTVSSLKVLSRPLTNAGGSVHLRASIPRGAACGIKGVAIPASVWKLTCAKGVADAVISLPPNTDPQVTRRYRITLKVKPKGALAVTRPLFVTVPSRQTTARSEPWALKGTRVTVHASGFKAYSKVHAQLQVATGTPGSGAAQLNGTAAVPVSVPTAMHQGTYAIRVEGADPDGDPVAATAPLSVGEDKLPPAVAPADLPGQPLMSPSRVTSSSGQGSTSLHLHLIDDVAGIASGYVQFMDTSTGGLLEPVRFETPTLGLFMKPDPFTGTAQDGVWTIPMTVPWKTGTYVPMMLMVTDWAGHVARIDGPTLTALGYDIRLTVAIGGDDADVAAPVLVPAVLGGTFSVGGAAVLGSAMSPPMLTGSVRLIDDRVGVPVSAGTLTWSDGEHQISAQLCCTIVQNHAPVRPPLDFTYQFSTRLDDSTPAGHYVLQGMTVHDVLGNAHTFSPLELALLGYDHTASDFDLYAAGADTTAPTVTSVRAVGGRTVQIGVHDDLAGVGTVAVTWNGPGGVPLRAAVCPQPGPSCTQGHLVSGTVNDGVYQFDLSTLGGSAPDPGDYNFGSVFSADRLGNSTTTYSSDLIGTIDLSHSTVTVPPPG